LKYDCVICEASKLDHSVLNLGYFVVGSVTKKKKNGQDWQTWVINYRNAQCYKVGSTASTKSRNFSHK